MAKESKEMILIPLLLVIITEMVILAKDQNE